MPTVSLTHTPLFAPHDIERRADPNWVLGPNGQLYITNLDHPTVPGKKLYVEGHRRQEALPPQDPQGTQPNSTIINASVAPTTSTFPESPLSLRTTTINILSDTSSTTPLSAPTALASPAFAPQTSRTQFPALFYVGIVLGGVCIITCGLVFLARRIRRSRANTEDDDKPVPMLDLLGDSPEPSLQVHAVDEEEPELNLPACITRQDSADRSSAGMLSVRETPRMLGQLRIANRVPGDLSSGDESSAIYRTTTHQSIRTGEVGSPRNIVQDPRQTPSSFGEDRLAYSSPSLPSRQVQRTFRVMENTSGIDSRERHFRGNAELHDPIVHGHPERWANVLRSDLMAAFGAVTASRSSVPEESGIPLDDAQPHWSQPLPESKPGPDVSLTALAEQPQASSSDVLTHGELSNHELGGDPGDRVYSLVASVSRSDLANNDNNGTDTTLIDPKPRTNSVQLRQSKTQSRKRDGRQQRSRSI